MVAIAGCGSVVTGGTVGTPGFYEVDVQGNGAYRATRLWAAIRPDESGGRSIRLAAASGDFVDLPFHAGFVRDEGVFKFSEIAEGMPADVGLMVNHGLAGIELDQHGPTFSGHATDVASRHSWNCFESSDAAEFAGTVSLTGRPAVLAAPEEKPEPIEVWPDQVAYDLPLAAGPPVLVREARLDGGADLQFQQPWVANDGTPLIEVTDAIDFGSVHRLQLTLEDLLGAVHKLTWTARAPVVPAEAPDLTFASGLGGYAAENLAVVDGGDGPRVTAQGYGILGFHLRVPEVGGVLGLRVSGRGMLAASAPEPDGSILQATRNVNDTQDEIDLDLSPLRGRTASLVLRFAPETACELTGRSAGELFLEPMIFR